jgi:siroheme synthase-like protein
MTMPFGYVISLDLDDHLAVVVGGGPVATSRVADLRDAGARVRVITPAPTDDLQALAAADPAIDLHVRAYADGDLDGARIAIATREDDLDVDAFWSESRQRGVLASVLDDLDHADFAAPALVRAGSLRIAVATAGQAPAVARRLREHLEATLGDAAGDLVEAAARGTGGAGPATSTSPPGPTAGRSALADLDGLLALVSAGRADEVVDHIVTTVRGSVHDRPDLTRVPPARIPRRWAHDAAPRPRHRGVRSPPPGAPRTGGRGPGRPGHRRRPAGPRAPGRCRPRRSGPADPARRRAADDL